MSRTGTRPTATGAAVRASIEEVELIRGRHHEGPTSGGRGSGNGSQPFPPDVLRRAVAGDKFWEGYLRGLWSGERLSYSLHLAVFIEPYLSYMLEGRKTIESRFSVVRCAPYHRVQRGDVVLLKLSAGPVVGLCRVGQTWFYRLDQRSWREIRGEFTERLCAQDPDFWRAREKASYATLMQVEDLRRLSPVSWAKRDRRGWVVLHDGRSATHIGRAL